MPIDSYFDIGIFDDSLFDTVGGVVVGVGPADSVTIAISQMYNASEGSSTDGANIATGEYTITQTSNGYSASVGTSDC